MPIYTDIIDNVKLFLYTSDDIYSTTQIEILKGNQIVSENYTYGDENWND